MLIVLLCTNNLGQHSTPVFILGQWTALPKVQWPPVGSGGCYRAAAHLRAAFSGSTHTTDRRSNARQLPAGCCASPVNYLQGSPLPLRTDVPGSTPPINFPNRHQLPCQLSAAQAACYFVIRHPTPAWQKLSWLGIPSATARTLFSFLLLYIANFYFLSPSRFSLLYICF